MTSRKELGETTDPKELVPGEPGQIQGNVDLLEEQKTKVTSGAQSFGAVTIASWTGDARGSYDTRRGLEKEKWTKYAATLGTFSGALSTYRTSLVGAQADAQRAIDKWEEGEKATQQAVTDYNAAVASYNAQVCKPAPTSPFGKPQVTVTQAPPGPFQDPGQALRDEAQEILDKAREDLDEAGNSAVQTLGNLDGGKTEANGEGPGADGDLEGPSFNWNWDDAPEGGKDPTKGPDGKYDDEHDEGPFSLSLGKASGEAWVLKGDASAEDYTGPVKWTANAEGSLLSADGEASAVLDKEGLRINAEGTAALAQGEASARGEWGHVDGGVTASGMVGVHGDGHANIGADGVHAGGELFAGAKADINGDVNVGGVGVEGGAEAWAGAGIAGDLDVGFDDGKLHLGGSGGIAWGVGGKLSGGVTLDFPEMYDTGKDVVDGVGDFLGF